MAEINPAAATAAFTNISPFTSQQSSASAQRVQDERNQDERAAGVQRADETNRSNRADEQPSVVARAAGDESEDSVAQSQASSETSAGFQRGSLVDIFV